ncbi:hypothetical protein N9L47_13160, partial [Rhodobacteraceae bacterium]|nr:hypothetical protein [Paracoccaceae bacterium]
LRLHSPDILASICNRKTNKKQPLEQPQRNHPLSAQLTSELRAAQVRFEPVSTNAARLSIACIGSEIRERPPELENGSVKSVDKVMMIHDGF